METWREGALLGHTHDPNDVTVEVDGVGRELRAVYAPREPDGPVFVDESGARSRRLRGIGWLVGAACGVYAAVLGVTLLSGTSDAPWLPGLGTERADRPAGGVAVSPSPTALDPGPGRPIRDASGAPEPARDGRARPAPPDATAPEAARGPNGPSTPASSPRPGDGAAEPGPAPEPSTPEPTAPEPTEPEPTVPEPDPGPGGTTTPPVDPPASPTAAPTGAAA